MRFKIIAAIILEFIWAGAITGVKAQVPPLITVEKIEIIGNTLFDSELEAIVSVFRQVFFRIDRHLRI